MTSIKMEVKNRTPFSEVLVLFMFAIITVCAEEASNSEILGALDRAKTSASVADAARKDLFSEAPMPSQLRRGVPAMGSSLISLTGIRTKHDGRNLHDFGQVRAKWPLDEGAGQLVFDKTKNDNRGFLGAGLGPDEQDPTWKESGRRKYHVGSKYLDFDGHNDIVKVPNDSSLEPRTVGVQAWVRGLDNQFPNLYVIAKGDDEVCAPSYGLFGGGFAGISFSISQSTVEDAGACNESLIRVKTESTDKTAAASIWNNVWNQVVGFFDGTCVAIYVNGELGDAKATDVEIEYRRSNSVDLTLGNYGDGTIGGLAFNGDLDEVQIGTSDPLAVPKGPQVVRVGTQVQFDASHSFLAMSYRWDFGYGKISTERKPTQVFKRPGIYEVCLKINAGIEVPDACENLFLEDTHCMKVVVYDPNERREVSGGGEIESPLGAYKKAKALHGHASFVFNAPQGPAEFNFQRAGLSLTSKSYKWYVVTRTQAVLEGTGYLRDGYGTKSATFMIFVTTAPKKTFRIRIEDLAGKRKVVYDSGAQTLSHGGNIQIDSY